jgi:hypothetical protein
VLPNTLEDAYMRLLNVMLAVTVACFAGAAGVAEAQTINACVMKNGLIKVVDDESGCGPQETPIALSQPQPALETARAFDGEGRDVGAFLDVPSIPCGERSLCSARWRVLLVDSGVIGILNPYSGFFDGSTSIRFSDLDCEGRGYVDPFWSNTLIPDARSVGSWLIGSTSEFFFGATVVRSILHIDGSCENLPVRGFSVSPFIAVEDYANDLGLTFPLPLPMWIGLSSAWP